MKLIDIFLLLVLSHVTANQTNKKTKGNDLIIKEQDNYGNSDDGTTIYKTKKCDEAKDEDCVINENDEEVAEEMKPRRREKRQTMRRRGSTSTMRRRGSTSPMRRRRTMRRRGSV